MTRLGITTNHFCSFMKKVVQQLYYTIKKIMYISEFILKWILFDNTVLLIL